jgi:hypothetical protein
MVYNEHLQYLLERIFTNYVFFTQEAITDSYLCHIDATKQVLITIVFAFQDLKINEWFTQIFMLLAESYTVEHTFKDGPWIIPKDGGGTQELLSAGCEPKWFPPALSLATVL